VTGSCECCNCQAVQLACKLGRHTAASIHVALSDNLCPSSAAGTPSLITHAAATTARKTRAWSLLSSGQAARYICKACQTAKPTQTNPITFVKCFCTRVSLQSDSMSAGALLCLECAAEHVLSTWAKPQAHSQVCELQNCADCRELTPCKPVDEVHAALLSLGQAEGSSCSVNTLSSVRVENDATLLTECKCAITRAGQARRAESGHLHNPLN
jgi:hypothetical protein